MTNQESKIFLRNEALSLIARLHQVQPFTLCIPMVFAAGVSDEAMRAITDQVALGIRELHKKIKQFISSLNTTTETPEMAQARFALLKLRFNDVLDQFDIFADVLSQRSEHKTGVWVAGLDVLAADALQLASKVYEPLPLMCFLERGHGAAIRKARTRLPGGDQNPVGIIQVPRERMIGSGIASSIIHEVGHQGAALLNLVDSLKATIRIKEQEEKQNSGAWSLYNLWISEIIADVWAVAHLGIGATLGLMNVVSLPNYFMFRIKLDDPHPFPWIRVKLSLAFGKYFFPHPQWKRYENLWNQLYPVSKENNFKQKIIEGLDFIMNDFVKLVANHRSKALKDFKLKDIFPLAHRQPLHLQNLYANWMGNHKEMLKASPSLVFAVIAQAKADKKINEHQETKFLSSILTRWAFMYSENRTKKDSLVITDQLQSFINT